MKHSNISFFVPHIGCPHCCSFCNQHTITSRQTRPTGREITEICSEALNQIKDIENTEIAFFGGSFTAIERNYMTELLNAAYPFIGRGKFHGIRVSTRPDCIDEEVLEILKNSNVTAIELGAQSMCDDVLNLNMRGHTSDDVRNSSVIIKEFGFELGLQMMVGLYGSTYEKDMYTAEEIIKLAPDTVRIYPTVILAGTELAERYKSGVYKTMDFEKAVELCSELLELFQNNNIQVIKLGLHASEDVERHLHGGLYHPAFKELCEGMIFRKKIEDLIENRTSAEISVSSKSVSKAVGQKKCNINYFKEKGISLIIKPSNELKGYEIKLG